MKKTLHFLLFSAIVVFYSSCSENFDVAAPYKPVAVIYGLLDKADSAHYIRVQKAFLDDSKSALNMAKVSDSSFFSQITVRMVELTMGSLVPFDSVDLKRVDLNTEGYAKDSGLFFNSPNYAYKFTKVLDPQKIYRLKVINNVTGMVNYADAPVIVDDNPLTGSQQTLKIDYLDDTAATKAQLDLSSVALNYKILVNGSYTTVDNFDFANPTTPETKTPVSVVQCILRFNWYDSTISGGPKTKHSFDYDFGYVPLATNQTGVVPFLFSEKAATIASGILSGMGKAGNNVVRYMDRCQLFVYMATPDLKTYISVQSLQGTGLTGNEIQPIYTNLQGKDVVGLFTSRGVRTGTLTLSNKTIQFLVTDAMFRDLKIIDKAY